MNCKNCDNALRTDYSFCPDCGAKVIRNRITAKNLFHDVIERYFNIDNTFVRTVWHLFTKPEVVIDGYIHGIRKKYLNPISYLGIALTLSGLLIFIMQKFYGDAIDFSGQGTNAAFAEKWAEFAFDFNAFMFLLYFPVLALPAYLLLNKVKYNLAEYILVFVYSMSHFSIVSFVSSVCVLLFDSKNYMTYSQISLFLILSYTIYVIQRINKFSISQLLGRGTVFSILVTIFFFILIIAIMILLLLVGFFELEDFKPSV